MPTKAGRKRVKVKAVPAAKKKLSGRELKGVKGGIVQGNFIGTDKAVTVGANQTETVGKNR